ncbi:MAG: AsmA family protein, partial [Sterolibacterium sp.]
MLGVRPTASETRAGRWLGKLGVLLLLPPLLAMLWIMLFGWNWARAPLERLTFEKTGRQLAIGGDLTLKLAWPAPWITARQISFANPPWAGEKQMLAVDEVEFSVDLPELLGMKLVFPEVRLTRPTVFLEKAVDGRKTWLLDRDQSDETAR